MAFGARDDYLFVNHETKEPKRATILDGFRPLRAALYMSSRGPVVVTCPDHDGGSDLKYIHPCVNPLTGILPGLHSDRLAPAVVRPHVVHPYKDFKATGTNAAKIYEMMCSNLGVDPRDYEFSSSDLERVFSDIHGLAVESSYALDRSVSDESGSGISTY